MDEYPEPKSIAMDSKELEFTFQVTKSDGYFLFQSEILVNKEEIPVSNYKNPRRFAAVVSEQLNSPIILKKAN